MEWADAETGDSYEITTGDSSGRNAVRVKTMRDIVTLYRRKREAKSLGPDGQPCHREPVDSSIDDRCAISPSATSEKKQTNSKTLSPAFNCWPRSTVYQLIDATPEVCAAVLTDYARAASYIPRMKSSRIIGSMGVVGA